MTAVLGTADEARTTSRLAYAAGVVGVLANVLLIAFYAVQAGRPERGVWLGSANDLVGAVGSALMVPVAIGLSALLPRRTAVRVVQVAGIAAMATLTVLGPLLVAGILPFQIQAPVALACFLVLAGWLLAINRWLRATASLASGVTRLGEWSGASALMSSIPAALGFALPAQSAAQFATFTVAALLAVGGMLAIPIWFLLLGRELSRMGPVAL